MFATYSNVINDTTNDHFNGGVGSLQIEVFKKKEVPNVVVLLHTFWHTDARVLPTNKKEQTRIAIKAFIFGDLWLDGYACKQVLSKLRTC